MRYFYINELIKKGDNPDGKITFHPKGNTDEVLILDPASVMTGLPYYGFPNNGEKFFSEVTKKIEVKEYTKKTTHKFGLCFGKDEEEVVSAKDEWLARMPPVDSPEFADWAREKPE